MAKPAPTSQTVTFNPKGTASRGPSSDAGLVLLHAEAFEQMPSVFLLNAAQSFVGREPPASGLAIPQSSVSRVHARLTRAGERITLADLNSRNGTFVNGVRATEATLVHGDVIRFGDAVFRLVTAQASRYAPFKLDGTVSGERKPQLDRLVGGLKLSDLAQEVERIAPSMAPVLIIGETGAGKEGVARSVHAVSGRTGPFLAVNCAAIPAPLFESELFGHEKGAFTGAVKAAPGMFRACERGTLLLDEIGDMPMEVQAKLLRVLEGSEVVPVGGYEPVPVDVRIVAATHRDLRALIEAGTFRADLYARLDGYTLRVPPLRDRLEDVPVLVRHFLLQQKSKQSVAFGFMYAALLYRWPFNVRELRAAVTRAVAVSAGKPLELEHLPEAVTAAYDALVNAAPAKKRGEAAAPVVSKKKRPTPDELRELIRDAKGNIAAVARTLDRDRALVHRWLKDADIDPEGFR